MQRVCPTGHTLCVYFHLRIMNYVDSYAKAIRMVAREGGMLLTSPCEPVRAMLGVADTQRLRAREWRYAKRLGYRPRGLLLAWADVTGGIALTGSPPG